MATTSLAGSDSIWATAWTTSMHGPYPAGNATAQPEMRYVIPSPERGAFDQSFRLMIRPDIWGSAARIRLSNVLGRQPVTFTGIHLGLQHMSSALLPGSNRPVTFGGAARLTLPPGQDAWSDPVALALPTGPADPLLTGRRLAVSFHVVGESGPISWHAKAMQTSYIAPPGSPPCSADEGEAGFPFPTTSWYFLDALDMAVPQRSRVVVCFGDSITDGSGSTVNGDDRWPDVLSRRLHAIHGNRVAVVNQGIGGNQILAPARYDIDQPTAGGPSALSRIERDVISLSGVSTVIWLEGINDLGHAGATSEALQKGIAQGVALMRRSIPGVRIVLATLTTALNATTGGHGTHEVDRRRRALNDFIRSSGLADAVIDFDPITRDAATGEMRAEMVPGSSIGGPGDKLHPNRLGYQAMGAAIDLAAIVPD